jgi:hypothetical protein
MPKLRMHGNIPPISQYVFMAWCLIKQEIVLIGVVLILAQGQAYFTKMKVLF